MLVLAIIFSRALTAERPVSRRPLILLSASYPISPIGAKLELSREVRVASILPFIRKPGIAFDDLATKAMGEAFDAACKSFTIPASRKSSMR